MPSERTSAGARLLRHITEIKKLVDETGAPTLLEFGAGKGHQYTGVTSSFRTAPGSRV
jgi:hypothetical protein